MRIACVVAVLAATAWAQDGKDKPKDPPKDPKASSKVDPVRVDAAIKKGIEWLKQARLPPTQPKGNGSEELILWTFVHGGVPEADPEFQKYFEPMVQGKLTHTYNVSLQAMILEHLDRAKHQQRLVACAQFLADNQARNGQWSYGEPSPAADGVASPGKGKDVATGGGKARPDGKGDKPRVTKKIPVKKEREGPLNGDNSNSQYAALGMRACHDAGVVFPRELIEKARDWWRICQNAGDGGRGWCYVWKDGQPSYGSMTAGALGSLAIYSFMLGEKGPRDPAIQSGVEWLARNWTAKENPGHELPDQWFHYFLYAVERAGILLNTEKFGTHEWYPEGANLLLDTQQEDGRWKGVWHTCFAILFLRRATRPLLQDVATGGKK